MQHERTTEFTQIQQQINDLKQQIEAINFRAIIHQVIRWNGLDIGVEYRPGDIRFKGRGFEKKMRSGYGHIRNHKGADGEALDCYLSPNFFSSLATTSDRIFEVIQISPEDGDFDEHKFMIGYDSLQEAEAAYLKEMTFAHFGGIKEVAIAQLRKYRKSPYPEQLTQTISQAIAPLIQKISEFEERLNARDSGA
jgi:hypothetical protein